MHFKRGRLRLLWFERGGIFVRMQKTSAAPTRLLLALLIQTLLYGLSIAHFVIKLALPKSLSMIAGGIFHTEVLLLPLALQFRDADLGALTHQQVVLCVYVTLVCIVSLFLLLGKGWARKAVLIQHASRLLMIAIWTMSGAGSGVVLSGALIDTATAIVIWASPSILILLLLLNSRTHRP